VDGAEAVQLVKQNPMLYDLILADVSMPALDGVSATLQIKELGMDTPVVALTADVVKEDVDS
jgi:osomolarity two-component system, sensor histidine kinase TcsA